MYGSLGIAVMLGWIDKSSRQIRGKCKCISCMDGIWQSLVSRITATPNEFYVSLASYQRILMELRSDGI